jgi:hypothetical protein
MRLACACSVKKKSIWRVKTRRGVLVWALGVGVMPAPNIIFGRSLEENERAMVATASPAEITRNPELVDAMTHRIIVRYA